MKTIAKALLTIIALAAGILVFAEAETAIAQIAVSGGAILVGWASVKGLEALGTFDDKTNK